MSINQNFLDMYRVRTLARLCTFSQFKRIMLRLYDINREYSMDNFIAYGTLNLRIYTDAEGYVCLSKEFEFYDSEANDATEIGSHFCRDSIRFKTR